MTEALLSRVASEVEDVLCLRRFRTRSRASSNAAVDERLVLEVDEVSAAVVGCSGACEEVVRASRAL